MTREELVLAHAQRVVQVMRARLARTQVLVRTGATTPEALEDAELALDKALTDEAIAMLDIKEKAT